MMFLGNYRFDFVPSDLNWTFCFLRAKFAPKIVYFKPWFNFLTVWWRFQNVLLILNTLDIHPTFLEIQRLYCSGPDLNRKPYFCTRVVCWRTFTFFLARNFDSPKLPKGVNNRIYLDLQTRMSHEINLLFLPTRSQLEALHL